MSSVRCLETWRRVAFAACFGVLAACGSEAKTGDDENGATGVAGMAAADGGSAGASAGSGGSGGDAVPGVWSHMGYDQKNNYYNPTETTLSVANAAQLVEKWTFTVAGFPPGTPVVGEGKVFALSTRGAYAIDLQTGAELWKRTDIRGTSSAAYEPGFVYFHGAAADLWKLDVADGSTVWGPIVTNDLTGCDGTSSPVIADDKVLVGRACGPVEVGGHPQGARGGVQAIARADGAKLWTYYTVEDPEDGAMVWSTVSVDLASRAVYATTGNNYTTQGENSDSFHAIDLDTGKQLWKRQVRSNDTWSLYAVSSGPDTDFGANPIIVDIAGKALVSAGDKGSAFWAIDRVTGVTEWSHPELSAKRDATHGGVLNNGAFDGKHIYCVANNPSATRTAVLHALDPANGGIDVWTRTFDGMVTWGAPSLANGLLVVPIDTKLYVLNAKDGKDLEVFDTGGTIAGGAAAIVDGKIIVKSGLQYAFDNTTKNNDKIIAYGLP